MLKPPVLLVHLLPVKTLCGVGLTGNYLNGGVVYGVFLRESLVRCAVICLRYVHAGFIKASECKLSAELCSGERSL